MAYEKNLLKKFGLENSLALKRNTPAASLAVNNMANPSYLRQSSALINDALKNGFDVLQLANGDIVTTGTKVIVTKYTWNNAKGKLVKAKAAQEKGAKEAKKPAPDLKVLKREMEDA